MDQGCIADVAMSNDPSQIRRGPKHLSRINVIDIFHRPVQCHKMARSGADNTLWRAGRS